MAGLKRFAVIISVSTVTTTSYLILSLYYIFPDLFKYQFLYAALTLFLITLGGVELTEPIDIFIAAILSSVEYLIIFHLIVAYLIEPYLYSGPEMYYFLSSLFLPAFFYVLIYLFIGLALYSIGYLIIKPKVSTS